MIKPFSKSFNKYIFEKKTKYRSKIYQKYSKSLQFVFF